MVAPSLFSGFQLLLLLLQLLGAEGQKGKPFKPPSGQPEFLGPDELEVTVVQDLGPFSVSAGETLTLKCQLLGAEVPGGVKWYKGSNRQQPPIYSQNESFPPRVSRVFPESNEDFTIRIRDIQPEDAGTYFCVKCRARATGEKLDATGEGTVVSVMDQWPLSNPGLWIGLVLSKIVAALFLSFLLLKKEPWKMNLGNTTVNAGPAKSAA